MEQPHTASKVTHLVSLEIPAIYNTPDFDLDILDVDCPRCG